jgi:lipopolysaccharide transport system ATP-binding protein
MTNIVISVENLSKSYQLGVINTGTFRGDTQRWWAKVRGLPDPLLKIGEKDHGNRIGETLWALTDVNFLVQQGEALGIIGRNGAGKSTLLKILSRVTAPTSGEIKVKGRIASLLEVGTGFHPELTGRENIFLNGAILGMKKSEIVRKFDEIVDFSGVEQFIDTPVKRYSSGMYVRLAFAVAAHLEPEILIVDEVLAVGDADFQKKCLGKMGEVTHEGRTVLFVSHNMQAIRKLCKTCFLLNHGGIELLGSVDDVINRYLSDNIVIDSQETIASIIANLPPDPAFQFRNIILLQNGITIGSMVGNGMSLEIEIEYRVLRPNKGLRVFFDLCDQEGTLLFRSFNDEQYDEIPNVLPGTYKSKAIIPANLLSPISYELIIYATIYNERYCVPRNGFHFLINVERTGKANQAYLHEPIRGKLTPFVSWTTSKMDL